jgi:hypothetical protein
VVLEERLGLREAERDDVALDAERPALRDDGARGRADRRDHLRPAGSELIEVRVAGAGGERRLSGGRRRGGHVGRATSGDLGRSLDRLAWRGRLG